MMKIFSKMYNKLSTIVYFLLHKLTISRNRFLSIVFPTICLGCKKHSEKILCEKCLSGFEPLSGFYCSECGRRLPTPEKACHKDAKFILAAPTSYKNETARELVHSLKYKGVKTAAQPIAEILAKYLKLSFENCELKIENFVVIPVPLHPRKERKRSFNQSLLIAENLSSLFIPNLKIMSDNLLRTLNTAPHAGIKNREERIKNIKDAFKLKNPEIVKGKNILLLDDVFTSGATMKEAARVLKDAGAGKIIALVFARA